MITSLCKCSETALFIPRHSARAAAQLSLEFDCLMQVKADGHRFCDRMEDRIDRAENSADERETYSKRNGIEDVIDRGKTARTT